MPLSDHIRRATDDGPQGWQFIHGESKIAFEGATKRFLLFLAHARLMPAATRVRLDRFPRIHHSIVAAARPLAQTVFGPICIWCMSIFRESARARASARVCLSLGECATDSLSPPHPPTHTHTPCPPPFLPALHAFAVCPCPDGSQPETTRRTATHTLHAAGNARVLVSG